MYEQRLNSTVQDAKYWLDKYTDQYKSHDKKMAGMRVEMTGKMENILEQIQLRVSIRDMKSNFKALNDLLFVKFSQLEDVKTAVRDVTVFQKYFYPLQMQALISENMHELECAMLDETYVRFTQDKYEDLLMDIELAKRTGKIAKDEDLIEHMNDLDEYNLRSTEWKLEPLE